MSPTPHAHVPAPETDAEMRHLKTRIAQTWAQRERLKAALSAGATPAAAGLRELEAVDRELSDLDSRFKRLWDATHAQPREPS